MLRTSRSILGGKMVPYYRTGDIPAIPPSIPQDSLLSWRSADAITGLSDGDPCGAWNDLVGTNNYTASGSQRPLYKTNVINGLPALLFDGSDDALVAGTNLTVGSSTVHIVCNFTGFGGYTCLLSAQKIAVYSALGDGEWGAYTSTDLDSGVTLDSNFKCLTTLFNSAADVEMWTNGASHFDNTSGSSYQSRTVTTIGAGNAAGIQSHSGYIAEVIIYSAAQTSTDYGAVQTYLMNKYGLS